MIPRLPRLTAALATLLSIGALSCSSDAARVNVVVFVIDTLRADRLGVYGHSRPTSPSIDALGADGVVFDHAYAPAPWTLPSVASLMTSTFPCEHGLIVDGDRIGGEVALLAQRMRAAKYATASFHANPYAGRMTGLERGFETSELRGNTGAVRVEEWLDGIQDAPFFLYIHNMEPHDPYRAPDSVVEAIGDPGEGAREAVARAVRRRRGGVDLEA